MTLFISAGGCSNERGFDEYCKFWKEEKNWCVEQKDQMKHFCPKECNFC